jgi:hypothetical protein
MLISNRDEFKPLATAVTMANARPALLRKLIRTTVAILRLMDARALINRRALVRGETIGANSTLVVYNLPRELIPSIPNINRKHINQPLIPDRIS